MAFTKTPLKVRLGELPLSINGELAAGSKGNIQTLELMRRVARENRDHPLVRDVSLQIINHAGTVDHHFLTEAQVIGAWAQDKVKYVRDPAGVEQLQDPKLMLREIAENGVAFGDCDDISLLIATMLLTIGAMPYFRAVKYRHRLGPFNHVYVVLYDRNFLGKKERLVLDGIVKHKPIGFEMPHKYGEEYPAF